MGQTALNTALALDKDGTLKKFEMIGARPDSIEKAEDRELFRVAMEKIGLQMCPRSTVNNFNDALEALDAVGLPAIIRSSFTLGGEGGGVAYNRAEFEEIVKRLAPSPVSEVLIEESVLAGRNSRWRWCATPPTTASSSARSNMDPMGVHTGDSITVAPALTLTDKEYQALHASLAVSGNGVDTMIECSVRRLPGYRPDHHH